MLEDDKIGLHNLIEEELNSNEKILKPDFSQEYGRKMLTSYLKTKFKQMYDFDRNASNPIIKEVRYNFINEFSARLINNPEKRIMIGVTGESASGKSTMCKAISYVIKSFNMPVTIIPTDNYFNDISDLIKKFGTFDELRDNGYDIDAPSSFQLDVLKNDLYELSLGNDVYSPEYLPNGTGVSVPHSKLILSNKVMIVEGIASMFDDVKDIFDIKVYVETDIATRRERFLRRAYTERNQDLNNAKKHWEYILGAGEKYVQPAREFADLILNGNNDMDYFCQLIEYIHTITNNFNS